MRYSIFFPVHRSWLLILLLAAAVAGSACQSAPRPRQVAVGEFEIALPGGDREHLAKTLPELLTASLAADSRIGVVDRYQVQQGLASINPGRDPRKLQKLGRQLNADYVIEGSLTQLDENYVLNARLFSVATGETVPGTSYFKSFPRQQDPYPSIQSVSSFMAYQVANYEKRVELAEKAQKGAAAQSRP